MQDLLAGFSPPILGSSNEVLQQQERVPSLAISEILKGALFVTATFPYLLYSAVANHGAAVAMRWVTGKQSLIE